jgi:hypothetical protein
MGFKIRVKAFYSLNKGFKAEDSSGSENRSKIYCQFTNRPDFRNQVSPKKIFPLQSV